MAKTPKTTEVGDFRSIPWNKLVRSKKNVRKVPSDDDLEFTEDIAQRGILSSILVRPQVDDAGADTGLFEVTAGGRRYDAVGRLVEQGRKPDTTPLPCQVRRTGIAEDDSLAENIQRAPLLDHVAKLSCKSSRKVGGAYAGPPAALLQRAGAGRPGISTCTLFAAVFSGNPAAACTSVQSI